MTDDLLLLAIAGLLLLLSDVTQSVLTLLLWSPQVCIYTERNWPSLLFDTHSPLNTPPYLPL